MSKTRKVIFNGVPVSGRSNSIGVCLFLLLIALPVGSDAQQYSRFNSKGAMGLTWGDQQNRATEVLSRQGYNIDHDSMKVYREQLEPIMASEIDKHISYMPYKGVFMKHQAKILCSFYKGKLYRISIIVKTVELIFYHELKAMLEAKYGPSNKLDEKDNLETWLGNYTGIVLSMETGDFMRKKYATEKMSDNNRQLLEDFISTISGTSLKYDDLGISKMIDRQRKDILIKDNAATMDKL